MRPLRRGSLPEDPVALARFLLGRLVVRRLPHVLAGGSIVETEAYLPDDAASHSFRGQTPRNRVMFDRPGHAYVYLCYGTAWMLNVSAGAIGIGAGVLIRAIEPRFGLDAMASARGTQRLRDLARGPGRLATALSIDRSLDGADLCATGPLFLSESGDPPPVITVSRRIGIARDAHRPFRFSVADSPYVSGPRTAPTASIGC